MSGTPHFYKHFDDDGLEWKAKKIKNVRIEHASINQINKARAKSKPLISHKQIATNNPAKAKLLRKEKLVNNGYEVILKITSNAKNTKQLSAHLNYISRHGILELLDSDLNLYTDHSQLTDYLENYQNGYVIPNENENKKERRETYNMVFSIRDYDDCDAVSLKNAAFETIKVFVSMLTLFLLFIMIRTIHIAIFVLRLQIIMEVALILKRLTAPQYAKSLRRILINEESMRLPLENKIAFVGDNLPTISQKP